MAADDKKDQAEATAVRSATQAEAPMVIVESEESRRSKAIARATVEAREKALDEVGKGAKPYTLTTDGRKVGPNGEPYKGED